MAVEPYPIPDNEAERIEALSRYDILDTAPEREYDHIAQTAAMLFEAPVALIAFLDGARNWFKAKVGTEVSESPRDISFCAHAIMGDEVMVVPDALKDSRFAESPLVANDPRIRFYAGSPILTRSGHKLGTLCILDVKPRRPWTERETTLLKNLTSMVTDRLELRRHQTIRRAASRMAGATSDAIVCSDSFGMITYWNAAAETLFGYKRSEAIGQPLDIIIPRRMQSAHAAGMMRVRHGGKPLLKGRTVEVVARRRDGTEFPVEVSISIWRDGADVAMGAIMRDISERRRTEERLTNLALYDQLTGLPNRTLLQERLQAAVALRAPLVQLILDLDRFKDVNDSLGYRAGDELLKAVAERLSRCVGENDTLARLSADEFAVLLAGGPDTSSAGRTADAILRALAEPFEVEGCTLHITASIGMVLCPEHCQSTEDILGNADLALQRAKVDGGNRSEFYRVGLRREVASRRSLQEDLRRAFANGELELHYQPQVRLSDEAVVGAEALMRWRHPERGVLPPGEFLAVLETSSLAAEVGNWTIETGCAYAASLLEAGLPRIRLGVNLFAAQFRAGTIAETVSRALDATGIAPADLELEITENIVLRHDEAMLAPLRELRLRGVGIAFDDFGTGYASLSMLKRFPLTRLKIDREFVRDLATDPDDAAIVRAVLGLGRNLALEVIAEGIENAEQAAFLKSHDCAEAQGYLYGKPMPGPEFAALLAKRSRRAVESRPSRKKPVRSPVRSSQRVHAILP